MVVPVREPILLMILGKVLKNCVVSKIYFSPHQDFELIAEINLVSKGFINAKLLARKFVTLAVQFMP